MPEFLGKIIFLENYDMTVSKRLITGVDIWLNTPTRPLEASGTSGEKAEMNGLLNFSVLDGWWYEGYRERAGWALTSHRTYTDQSMQDKLDAATIYSMLENEIIPLYFAKNSKGYSPEWIQYIKNSISQIAPNYTMSRMMKDYIDRFYCKEAARSKKLRANDYALVREIVAWKQHVAENWDNVQVEDMQLSDSFYDISINDGHVDATVKLNTAGLGSSVGLELVVYHEIDGETKFHSTIPMKVVEEDGDIITYQLNDRIKDTGIFKLSFRAYPWNKNLPHRQDFAYVKWF